MNRELLEVEPQEERYGASGLEVESVEVESLEKIMASKWCFESNGVVVAPPN